MDNEIIIKGRLVNENNIPIEGEITLVNDYLSTESGEALVDDCKTIIVEKTFESHWALLEGYHALGERIINDSGFQQYAKGNTTSLQRLAQSLKISDRTLYYSMQFYQKYPDMNALPDGKLATWTRVIKTLPQSTKELKACEHQPIVTCKVCKKDLTEFYVATKRI